MDRVTGLVVGLGAQVYGFSGGIRWVGLQV